MENLPNPRRSRRDEEEIICNIFGIAAFAASVGDPLDLSTVGVYQLPKATAAVLTVGAGVALDNTAKNINVPGTGRFPVGIATEAAVSPKRSEATGARSASGTNRFRAFLGDSDT